MIRNTHRVGLHLMVDDESGIVHWSDDMRRDWDGQMRHKDNLDGRHPQLDVGRAVRRDPKALKDIRPKSDSELPGWYILLESAGGGSHSDGQAAIVLEANEATYLLTES